MTALTSFFAACGAGTIPSSEGGDWAVAPPLEERYVPPHFHKDYSRGGSWRHSVHKGYFGEPGTTQVYQS